MAADFIAGCIGGAAGVLAGHPLDTVKVRLQTQTSKNVQFTGTVDCLRTTINNEGMRGLYRGLSSPLCGVTAVNALTFGIQGNVRRLLHEPDSLSSQFLAGMIAGACQSVIVSPMELVKSQMQMQSVTRGLGGRHYTSSWHCCRDIMRRDGLRHGLMRGFWVTVLRETPAFGIYFGTYELLTSKLYGERHLSLAAMLAAGGTAGVASWVLTYPIDVVKTRMQTDGMNGRHMYLNYWDCVRHSCVTDGWRGLWRGLGSACLRAFPTNAVTLATVSTVLQAFDGHHDAALEEYWPADAFLQQLQRPQLLSACYPQPRVSITTTTTTVWRSSYHGARGRDTLRAMVDTMMSQGSLARLQNVAGGEWCGDGRRAVQCAWSGGGEGGVIEQAADHDDELSEWGVRWSCEPPVSRPSHCGTSTRSGHRKTTVTRLIKYEEHVIIEHHDGEDDEDQVVCRVCGCC